MRCARFLFALVLTIWAQTVWPETKVPVIGVLVITPGPDAPIFQAFRLGLRERGYVEGRDY
jgi:hypothetical protein